MVVPSILTLSTANEATPLTAPLLIVAVPSVNDPPVTAPEAVTVAPVTLLSGSQHSARTLSRRSEGPARGHGGSRTGRRLPDEPRLLVPALDRSPIRTIAALLKPNSHRRRPEIGRAHV